MKQFNYKGFGRCESKCGVTIIDENGKKTVVLTELPDNPGTSITNFVEGIATLVHNQFLPDTPPESIRFIEHYPSESRGGDDETFDLVILKWDGKQFRGPLWKPLPAEEVEKIKRQMEWK